MRLRQKTRTSVGGSTKVLNKMDLPLQFLAGEKNCSDFFHRCSLLVRQFPRGFLLVKSCRDFPSENNLCPDTVASKDEDFSADIFVQTPSPILAELPMSTHIYITFFTKRSVNSLQTARPTEG